jgi:hypothetical protein
LPSGTLWATCNVGATNPEYFGNYYAWGETAPKDSYTFETYIYAEGSSYNDPRFTKYCDNSFYGNDGFVDSLTTLEMSDDAATVNWGEDWRMPTMDELYELINNCTHEWTTQNGVNGFLFTGINGNSIFFPAASRIVGNSSGSNTSGLYWSSSLAYMGREAQILSFNNSGYCDVYINARVNGLPVRPVRMKATVETNSAFNITNTSAILAGNVTNDWGDSITSRGFLYGTSSSNLSNRVVCGLGTGSFTKTLTGLAASTTYYYKAYATNSIGTAYGEVRSFTTTSYSAPTGHVNGYGYVDLGLPSGTKWATCNVGADSPIGYGDYFAWGETTVKSNYSWNTYSWCNGSSSTLTKYCNDSEYGYNGFTDYLNILYASDDAATANWGSGWRMPTKEEFEELINNCTYTWTIENGVTGFLFKGPNRNSIFLPAAGCREGSDVGSVGSNGYYWSSSLYLGTGTLYSSNPNYARCLYLLGDPYMGINYRYYGYSVRPVCGSNGN